MYQATIFTDSPCLHACRKILGKHKLTWEEEQTTFKTINQWSGDIHKEGAAIHIRVTGKLGKAVRAPSKPRKQAAKDSYSSKEVSEGVHVWETPSGLYTASFGYDAKAQDRIRKEAQREIDARLKAKSDFLTYRGE